MYTSYQDHKTTKTILAPEHERARTWIELDASAFNHNINTIASIIAPSKIYAVIKSHAYGHGLEHIGKLAQQHDSITGVCVMDLQEASLLRANGITKPILTLGHTTDIQTILGDETIHVTIYSISQLENVIYQAREDNKPAHIHLKIDTGMTRLGFTLQELPTILRMCAQAPIVIHGLSTHLADKDNHDDAFSHTQLQNFEKALSIAVKLGFSIPQAHALSSGALHLAPAHPFLTIARVGTNCYGFHSSEISKQRLQKINPLCTLQPVLNWKTQIIQTKSVHAGTSIGYARTFTTQRTTRVGILPIGYADGFARGLSNKASVAIANTIVPVLGLVSMNLIAIDISDIPEAEVGSDVTLLGTLAGITAHDHAQALDTISIEVTTRLHPQINRRIIEP